MKKDTTTIEVNNLFENKGVVLGDDMTAIMKSKTIKKEYYENTKIELIKNLQNIKGTKFFLIKNYSDSRVFDLEISEHLAKNKLTVSWSGGKDSTITAELLFRAGKNPLIVLCDMGYEFDETYTYIKTIIKRWIKLYNATIVILDTQYFFLNRIFTVYEDGYSKGLVRGFPHTNKMTFCTRDGKIRPNNYLIKTNSPKDTIIEVALGYAKDENRSVKDEDNLHFIYPLKEHNYKEIEVLQLTKKWNIFNPYYDFFFRGGCIGCPKQGIDQFQKTYKFYKCQFAKWVEIETELHRLYKIEEIANPYMFTRINENTKEFSIKMTSNDLIKYFYSNQTLGFDGYEKEISCMCG
jgi:3'-phosphoadenosine 5'-phosphosulfate sulfotransferase (PAPS reductase)/FAD synthetase